MIGALTGWLGLTVLVLAIGSGLAADAVRQHVRADGPEQGRLRRWVLVLTLVALGLAAVGTTATVLRFVTLT